MIDPSCLVPNLPTTLLDTIMISTVPASALSAGSTELECASLAFLFAFVLFLIYRKYLPPEDLTKLQTRKKVRLKFLFMLGSALLLAAGAWFLGVSFTQMAHYPAEPPPNSYGIWIWGCELCLVALLLLTFICYASFHAYHDPSAENTVFRPHTDGFRGLHAVMRDIGSLVGVVLGFASLALIQFIGASSKDGDKKEGGKEPKLAQVLVIPEDKASRRVLYELLKKDFEAPMTQAPGGESHPPTAPQKESPASSP